MSVMFPYEDHEKLSATLRERQAQRSTGTSQSIFAEIKFR